MSVLNASSSWSASGAWLGGRARAAWSPRWQEWVWSAVGLGLSGLTLALFFPQRFGPVFEYGPFAVWVALGAYAAALAVLAAHWRGDGAPLKSAWLKASVLTATTFGIILFWLGWGRSETEFYAPGVQRATAAWTLGVVGLMAWTAAREWFARNSAGSLAWGPARCYLRMTKPGLNALVLVTAGAGYWMAQAPGAGWMRGAAMVVLTALVAAGASVLNQATEIPQDALMQRTSGRPLPAGQVSAPSARVFGAGLALTGLLGLLTLAGPLTAFLAAMTLATYVFLYTPLKRMHSVATLWGAVCGALPPVLGWTAASGRLAPGALVLFLILFLWQIPHFLAIVWKYREQYERAGFVMLSVGDRDGRRTARQALLYALILLPASLLPALYLRLSLAYWAGALALGLGFLGGALLFLRVPGPISARRLFLASIAYLPLLMLLMTLDYIVG